MLEVICRWPVLLLLAAGMAPRPALVPAPAPVGRRPGQAQAAGLFLRAVLHANYPGAYARLAPEVRQSLSLSQFVAAARPLWKSGQRHGPDIELYKLGMRLGDRGGSRLFYTFSFAADSAAQSPSELLEVTFRDTATRVVLGFGLLGKPTKAASRKPSSPAGKK